MDNLSLHKAIGTELRVIAESLATIGTLLERIGSTGDSESLAVSESQTNQSEKGVRDRAGRANALTMYHLEMKPKIEEENRGLSAMDIYRKIVDMWKMLTAPEKTVVQMFFYCIEVYRKGGGIQSDEIS